MEFLLRFQRLSLQGFGSLKLNKKWIPSAFEKTGNAEAIGDQKPWKLEETPGFGVSVLTAVFPIVLMFAAAFLDIFQKQLGFADNLLIEIIRFIGNAPVALLISLILAMYTMGIARKIPMKDLTASAGASINAIGLLILITGGGGAFKQVIIDGGVGEYIAGLFDRCNHFSDPTFMGGCRDFPNLLRIRNRCSIYQQQGSCFQC